MSNAPNYTPTTSFAADETNQVAGRSTVKTVSVDTELANISASINAINTNLKLLQRDDTKLKDFLIEPYALSEQTRALLAASGVVRGLWAASTAYGQGDAVQHSNFAYLCISAHTSSGSFDAALWISISGDGTANTAAAAALASQTAAGVSAAAALASQTAAGVSAAAALASQTAAGISQVAASNSSTAAGNSAIAASASAASADASRVAAAASALAANVQNGSQTYLGTVAGTNTITAAASPTLTAQMPTGSLWKLPAAGANTGATTVNVDSQGAISVVRPDGTALQANDIPATGYICLLEKRASDVVLLNPANLQLQEISQADARYTQQAVKVRQTVSQGPVDTAGLPTFLAATYASLVVTTQNVSTGLNSLVATSSSGSGALGDLNVVGQSTANLTWPACTANQTNYLPVSISGGVLTPQTPVILAPIYQWGGTPAVTNGQYTFNIQQMTMYLGNGATAPAVNHVIVGESVAGASTITSTVAYALNGKYDSGLTATLPAVNTAVIKNSNIGVKSISSPMLYLECLTTEHGYAVGDRVVNLSGSNGSWYEAQTLWFTRNAVGFGTDAGQSFSGLQTKTGGTGNFTLTLANWAYGISISRGW